MQPQIAIVTGASRGIGAATAALLAENGCRVVVNYHKSKEQAEALCARLSSARPGIAAPFCADVSAAGEAAALAAFCLKTFGAPDLLVLNAGVSYFAPADATPTDAFERVMAVNLGGAVNVARAALPAMIAKKRGAIVAVSSIWGERGASCESAYAASKAAVAGYIKSLAQELGPSGITANCVAPGFIETDMNVAFTAAERADILARVALGRAGSPEDVAALVLSLAQNEYVTGQVVGIDGGMI